MKQNEIHPDCAIILGVVTDAEERPIPNACVRLEQNGSKRDME